MPSRPAPPGDPLREALAFVVLCVFLPFSAGGFLSYLFRSLNAVMAPDLVRDLDLGAGDLGFLTAVYFVTFAGFQLPLGLLLDRFGPRRVQAGLLPIAALGAFVVAVAHSLPLLAAGRALIGLGVAGAVLACFKATALWVPRSQVSFVNGMFMAAGAAGAMAATTPIAWLLGVLDWREIHALLGALILASALWILLAVPRWGEGTAATEAGAWIGGWRGLTDVFHDPLFWRVAPLCAVSSATNLALQGLWAGPWLADVAGLGREAVARELFFLALALTLGFAVLGAAASLLERRGVPLERVIVVGLGLYQLAQLGLILELIQLRWLLWGMFGFFGQAGSLGFALLARHFPPTHAGRATTGLSLLIFGGAFLAQALVGWVIDLVPPVETAGYAPLAYQLGFGVLLALQLGGLAWFLWPRAAGPPDSSQSIARRP